MLDSVGLDVGESAPAFAAPLVSTDASVDDVSLASLLEDRPVLLCFYTNDSTPDCIEEWCGFRDYQYFSVSDRIRVVGISESRPGTHRRCIDHLGLTFPLFSDTDLSVAEAFDVKYRVLGLLPRSRRSCFLVDRDRTIRYRWIGTHPLDPTRDTPDLYAIHEAIRAEFGDSDADASGW